MIKINDKTISSVYSGEKIVEKIYRGTLLVYEGWKKLLASGVPPLTIYSKIVDLVDYKLYGNSVQDGTPTPETPIEIESVGEYDEETGKYKIPVKVSNEVEEITTNIYLNEPLRKVDDVTDYIDFKNKKVVRNVGSIIFNGSGNWMTYTSSNGYMHSNTTFIDGEPVMCNILENSQINIKTLAIRKNFKNIYAYGVSDIYPTIKDWKTFLTTTNMEVIGKLVTPIEEAIELPTIPTHKGTNIIEVDTEVQPSNLEVVYKGK